MLRYAVVGCAGIGPTHADAVQAVEDGEIGDLVFGEAHVKWFRPQGYYDSGG